MNEDTTIEILVPGRSGTVLFLLPKMPPEERTALVAAIKSKPTFAEQVGTVQAAWFVHNFTPIGPVN